MCIARLRIVISSYGVHDDDIANLISETSRDSHHISIQRVSSWHALYAMIRYRYIIIIYTQYTFRTNNETEQTSSVGAHCHGFVLSTVRIVTHLQSTAR